MIGWVMCMLLAVCWLVMSITTSDPAYRAAWATNSCVFVAGAITIAALS